MRKDGGAGMRKIDLLASLMLRRMPGRQKPTNFFHTAINQGKVISGERVRSFPAFKIEETGSHIRTKELQAPAPKHFRIASVRNVSGQELRTPSASQGEGTRQARRIVKEVIVKQQPSPELKRLILLLVESSKRMDRQLTEAKQLRRPNPQMQQMVAALEKMFTKSGASLQEQFAERNRLMEMMAKMMAESDAQIGKSSETHNQIMQTLSRLAGKEKDVGEEDFSEQGQLLQSIVNEMVQRNQPTTTNLGMLSPVAEQYG